MATFACTTLRLTSPRTAARALAIVALAGILLSGCESEPGPATKEAESPGSTGTSKAELRLPPLASSEFWQNGSNALAGAADNAHLLRKAINTLLDSPSQASLTAAQQAWDTAQASYREFFIYSHLHHAQPGAFALLDRSHYRIAAYPVQPGYLDSFGPYPYSGMVHDISMPLTKESLINQHGMTDTEDAALGYYAMGYLLFGDGGGREPTDFIAHDRLTSGQQEQGYKTPSETPNNRRRQLLALQAEMLSEDLQILASSWTNGTIRNQWQALSPRQQHEITRSAFEQAVSDLLLEVIAQRQTDDSSPGSFMPEGSRERRVTGALESLRSALTTLPEESRPEINEPLTEALHALTNSADTNNWHQAVYQHLKTAAERLQPTLNSG